MKLFKLTRRNGDVAILVFSIFVAGLCSIVYELLIGSASSYFLGDSVTQFSLTIGLYMAAMGGGALLSRLIHNNLIRAFIINEIILGLIGGLSIPILYFAFSYTDFYMLTMITMIILVGIFTGLEVPLLSRIMDEYQSLDKNLSNVLSLDYLGALLATLLFPFLLLPFVGVFKTSLIFGVLNMSIGFANLYHFRKKLGISPFKSLLMWSIVATVFLSILLLFSQTILRFWENDLYEDKVVYAKQSKYQRIVVTRGGQNVRLFLNGNLQFSSKDEYRYHESLVHIPLSQVSDPKHILFLGGGDGLGVRDALHYPGLEKITLVDLDAEMLHVAKTNPYLVRINQQSLAHPKVDIIPTDAFSYIQESKELYDAIIVDLPDPNNNSLARMYSREFYQLIKNHLSPDGVFVTQATSVYYSREAFWCIKRTVEAAGYVHVYPYHTLVPSFGDWGFVMGTRKPVDPAQFRFPFETQYLTPRLAVQAFTIPKDLAVEETDISTIDKPRIVGHYTKGWQEYN